MSDHSSKRWILTVGARGNRIPSSNFNPEMSSGPESVDRQMPHTTHVYWTLLADGLTPRGFQVAFRSLSSVLERAANKDLQRMATRSDMEAAKWINELAVIIRVTPTTMKQTLVTNQQAISLVGVGKRVSTLRSRMRAACRHQAWLMISCAS